MPNSCTNRKKCSYRAKDTGLITPLAFVATAFINDEIDCGLRWRGTSLIGTLQTEGALIRKSSQSMCIWEHCLCSRLFGIPGCSNRLRKYEHNLFGAAVPPAVVLLAAVRSSRTEVEHVLAHLDARLVQFLAQHPIPGKGTPGSSDIIGPKERKRRKFSVI
ncbi:hypothetical protein CEXT_439031 [Caerostris extrusa]|uniref:Uncharacterized protein n=1 Tax=Caerostris extrusa TaxID=172846 RepID=A0AAV4NZB3_CAEEX|nr:hypothetical protein CEXT_439031 [Caerostris extrusa]